MSKKLKNLEESLNLLEVIEISKDAVRLLEVFAFEEAPFELDMDAMEETTYMEKGKMTWGTWFIPGGELVADRGNGFCMVSYNGTNFTFKLKANDEAYSYGFIRPLDVTEDEVRGGAAEMRLATLLRKPTA